MKESTAAQLLKVAREKLDSGEALSNRIAIDPKDELDIIKKCLCEPFSAYYVQKRYSDVQMFATDLEIDISEAKYMIYYHIDKITLDQIVTNLVKLAAVDTHAKKTLHRLALSA